MTTPTAVLTSLDLDRNIGYPWHGAGDSYAVVGILPLGVRKWVIVFNVQNGPDIDYIAWQTVTATIQGNLHLGVLSYFKMSTTSPPLLYPTDPLRNIFIDPDGAFVTWSDGVFGSSPLQWNVIAGSFDWTANTVTFGTVYSPDTSTVGATTGAIPMNSRSLLIQPGSWSSVAPNPLATLNPTTGTVSPTSSVPAVIAAGGMLINVLSAGLAYLYYADGAVSGLPGAILIEAGTGGAAPTLTTQTQTPAGIQEVPFSFDGDNSTLYGVHNDTGSGTHYVNGFVISGNQVTVGASTWVTGASETFNNSIVATDWPTFAAGVSGWQTTGRLSLLTSTAWAKFTHNTDGSPVLQSHLVFNFPASALIFQQNPDTANTTTLWYLNSSYNGYDLFLWAGAFTATALPTRQFPRDDNLALGAARQGAVTRSSSAQHSIRQGWRGTYS